MLLEARQAWYIVVLAHSIIDSALSTVSHMTKLIFDQM